MKTYKFRGLQARRRREELGLSAQQVGALVGVSESAVCAYERASRQPRYQTYVKLCAALQVPDESLREPIESIPLGAGSAA